MRLSYALGLFFLTIALNTNLALADSPRPLDEEHEPAIEFLEILRRQQLDSGEFIKVGRAATMDVRRRFVERSRGVARDIVADAYHHPRATEYEKEIFRRVWNRLATISIEFPEPGREYNKCDDEDLWGFYRGYTAYLCASLLSPANSPSQIVGVIIHEILHDTHPHFSECEVSRAEFTALAYAGKWIRGNGYVRSETCPNLRKGSRIRNP